MEGLTKEDLRAFRVELLAELKVIVGQMLSYDHSLEWLKSAEMKRLLKVSDATLQNMRINGTLHPVKIAGSWYYNRHEVEGLFKVGDGS